jgi:lysophospholipase L1-like esterase
MAYAPIVQLNLGSKADILHPKENCEDSNRIRKRIKKWLKQFDGNTLTIIHINCGLHDIKRKYNSAKHQVPIRKYEENLREILRILQSETPAQIIWATTTPVIFERHHARKGFDRFLEDIDTYNQKALQIMKDANIAINDLNHIIQTNNPSECILEDGVHMTEKGNSLLASAVTEKLKEYLL